MATQSARAAGVKTPLDDDVLVLRGMHGTEELGRLFRYELSLASDDQAIDANDLLGKPVTVWLELADESKRYFNGFVSRFVQSGSTTTQATYQASIRPWLWFLTREADCRIFQELTVPEIVQKVFEDNGFSEFELSLSGSYEPWVYCVQYRETDFNFVSRLLEQEGIYYFFKHEDGKHTLVLADAYGAHAPIAGNEQVPFTISPDNVHVECISEMSITQEVHTGVYSLRDYDFEQPSLDLTAQTKQEGKYAHAGFEIYDYPGEYLTASGGSATTKTRIQEIACQHERVTGTGTARGFTPGGLFTLTDFPRDDQNREYLVLATTHEIQPAAFETGGAAGGPVCVCGFVAIDSKIPFRPARLTPKPVIQGPQTAIVVGPDGDEIYTDNYGRVKVQFHWDRYGEQDENSSCWIRVSQPWAGKGWGAVSTPRIGQEVIVDFLEGDPDQPIITGRVYNADCQPPFGFPAGAVSSGIKSSTHKGQGYNEMSMDDTAGKEKFTIHGQYDMNTTVGNNQTNKVGVDQTEDVGAKREVTIGSNDKVTIGANRETSIAAKHTVSVGSNEDVSVGGSRQMSVKGKEDVTIGGKSTLQVGGSRTETIAGSHTIVNPRMTITTASQCTVAAGSNLTGTSAKVNLLAGSKFLANSGGKMDVKAAAALTQQSGAAMNVKSGAGLNVQSSAAMNLKSGAAMKTEASGAMNLKAGGPINGKGSIIKLNSPTNIKGTTLTVK